MGLLLFAPLLLAAGPAVLSPILRDSALYARVAPRTVELARVRVSVRFETPPTAEMLCALRARGATVIEIPGHGPAVIGKLVSVEAPFDRLSALAALPGVARIEPAGMSRPHRPLDHQKDLTGASVAWSPPGAELESILGEGVIVADHEGGMDIYHPDFFRPDGGYFDWIDHDGDGLAGVGDRLDLDGDGTAESRLSVIESLTYDSFSQRYIQSPEGYQPDLDFIFIDLNENGERDAGRADGFDDTIPAFGEPVFAADDLDRDGTLEPGEPLIRLKTSKVRAIYDYGRLYERGVNLTDYIVRDEFDFYHGTSCIGGVGAGWPGLRRYTGMAPGAELVMINSFTDEVAGIAAAKMLGAHLSFYETSLPDLVQDGSDPFSLAIDEAAAAGIVQLSPAGNMADSEKAMKVENLGSTPVRVGLTTEGREMFDYRLLKIRLSFRETEGVSIALLGPGGARLELAGERTTGNIAGIPITATMETTSKGNRDVVIIGDAVFGTIPTTTLAVELSSAVPVPLVRGLLFDDVSGTGPGIRWIDHLTTEGTALVPSTASAVIAVGAYTGYRAHEGETIGARAPYSGMGPRIDGQPIVDLSAPAGMFAPIPNLRQANYAYIGGTSSALPMAAGAVALLLSSGVPLSQQGIEAILRDSARHDEFTADAAPEEYGAGKLDVAQALFQLGYQPGDPPALEVLAPATAVIGAPVVLEAQVAAEVVVAWDADFDGHYEHGYGAPRVELVFDTLGVKSVFVQAKSTATGRVTKKRISLEVIEAPPPPPPPMMMMTEPDPTAMTPELMDGGCGCRETARGRASWWLWSLLFFSVSKVAGGRRSATSHRRLIDQTGEPR